MKKSLIFVQNDEASENAQNVQVHIEADRASALELLALGTRSVMETLSISLYEYLEVLKDKLFVKCLIETLRKEVNR